MRKNSIIIKVISLAIAILFTHEQIGWVQDGIPVWTDLPDHNKNKIDTRTSNIEIPNYLAEVKSDILPDSTREIIHIQDTHASLSAQESIATILDQLASNYDVNLIGIEGAEGFIDTSLLRSVPDKKIRENTARYLMENGKLSASEFFSATSDKDNILLVGIEKDSLYEKNLAGVRGLVERRDAYVNEVRKLQRVLDQLSENIYSKELSQFEKLSTGHRKGNVSFPEYYKGLISLFSDDGKILEKTGNSENIRKLFSTIELEKNIDFKEANAERERLLDILGKTADRDTLETLVGKVVLFKEKKISQTDFYSYLGDLAAVNGLDPGGYINFIKYTQYISLYSDIDILALYLEVETLEENLVKQLYANKDQEELYKWRRLVQLFVQLYDMEFSNGDFEYLCRKMDGIKISDLEVFLKETASKLGLAIHEPVNPARIIEGVAPAIDFYRVAEDRNKSMIDNTIANMRKEGKNIAALVTGGFHTKGLTKLIAENNLSCLVITPKYEEGKERPYIAILTNKKKPYQKLLDSGKYEIAVRAYFGNMDEEKLFEIVLPSLAQVVAKGGNWKEEASKYASVYGKERERVMAGDRQFAGHSLTVEEFRKYLGIDDVGADRLDIRKLNDGKVYTRRVKENGEVEYLAWGIFTNGAVMSPYPISVRKGNLLWFGLHFSIRIPLKNLIAPHMDDAVYALRVAWWVESILFFVIPVVLPIGGLYLITGSIHPIWPIFSIILTVPLRWTVFKSHPDVEEIKFVDALRTVITREPLRNVTLPRKKYIAPLDISFAGMFLSVIPLLSPLVNVTSANGAISASVVMVGYQLFREIMAITRGETPGVMQDDSEARSPKSARHITKEKYDHLVYDPKRLDIVLWKKHRAKVEDIKGGKITFSGADWSSSEDASLGKETKLRAYFDIMIDKLCDGLGGVLAGNINIDKTELKKKMGLIIDNSFEGNRDAALKWFDGIKMNKENNFEIVLNPRQLKTGSGIGMLSSLDLPKCVLNMDLGMLYAVTDSDVLNALIAMTLGAQFLGFLYRHDQVMLKNGVGDRGGSGGTDPFISSPQKDNKGEVITMTEYDALNMKCIQDDLAGAADIFDRINDFISDVKHPSEVYFTANYKLARENIPRFLGNFSPDIPDSLRRENARLKRVGRYEIGGVLGAGGMGIVLYARDHETGDRVAIKMIKNSAGSAPDANLLNRFELENISGQLIDDSRVIKSRGKYTYTTQVAENVKLTYDYMVLPYIPYYTLTEYMEIVKYSSRGGGLSAADMAKVFEETIVPILGGLDVIHEKEFIHRDIKPDNVMVDPDDHGKVIIMDMGLSRKLDDEKTRNTLEGQVLGSKDYISPEQSKDAGSVTRRTDLWSMGVILYEIATGRRPFIHQKLLDLLIAIQTKEPIPPSAINPNVDPELERIILKALTKDEDQRYQTAQEMIDDLQAWVAMEKPEIKRVEPNDTAPMLTPRQAGSDGAISGLDLTPPSRQAIAAEKSGKKKVSRKQFIAVMLPIIVLTFAAVWAIGWYGIIPFFMWLLKKLAKTTTVPVGPTETSGKSDEQPAIQTDNRALLFGGKTGYFDCGDSKGLANVFDGGGTISFWMSSDDYRGRVIDKKTWDISFAGNREQLVFTYRFDGSNDSARWEYFGNAISHYGCNHIAISYDSSNPQISPRFVINGQLETNVKMIKPAIGKRIDDANHHLCVGLPDGNYTFNGTIRDVAVFKEELPIDYIAGIHTRGIDQRREGIEKESMVGYWRCDEGDGDTVYDATSSGNNGIMPELTDQRPVWVKMKVLTENVGTLLFDGLRGRVKVISSAAITNIFRNSGKIEFLLFPNEKGPKFSAVLSKNDLVSEYGIYTADFNKGYLIYLDRENSNIVFEHGFSEKGGRWVTESGSISWGQVLRVEFEYDATSVNNDPVIHINGKKQVLYCENRPKGVCGNDEEIPLFIGDSQIKENTYSGQIGRLSFYRKEGNGPFKPVAKYNFGEEAGSRVSDAIGHNDGSLEPPEHIPKRKIIQERKWVRLDSHLWVLLPYFITLATGSMLPLLTVALIACVLKAAQLSRRKNVEQKQILVAIPENAYDALSAKDKESLGAFSNAKILLFDNGISNEYLALELERYIRRDGAFGAIVLDYEGDGPAYVKAIGLFIDGVSEATNLSPSKSGTKIQNIKRLGRMSQREWRVRLGAQGSGLEELVSFRISERNIFDENLWRLTAKTRSKIKPSNATMNYLRVGPQAKEQRCVSIAVRTVTDMRSIAEILGRVGAEGTDKRKILEYLQLRVSISGVDKYNIADYMYKTGLDKYLEVENILFVSEKTTFAETLRDIRTVEKYSSIRDSQIVVGDYRDFSIELTANTPKDPEAAPLYVQMKGPGLAGQLLLAVIGIINNEKMDKRLGHSFEKGQRWFEFLPNIGENNIETLREMINCAQKAQSMA
ncbi:MAG: protein kinase [Candidatus Omnitrophica bacterium]|nr:protein kinase [Candidatus Omnitrophota bacterium]